MQLMSVKTVQLFTSDVQCPPFAQILNAVDHTIDSLHCWQCSDQSDATLQSIVHSGDWRPGSGNGCKK